MTSSEEILRRGIDTMKLSVPPDFERQTHAYLSLLKKWNRVYSLTALREGTKLVSHHILDSLGVVPHLRGRLILDVGSGPGFPGIPIALARPDWTVTLLDSNQKKTAFLSQVIAELGLANVSVRRERVESWKPASGFNEIVSRAFADLGDFARLAGHLLAPSGRMLAMKGLYPHEEITQLPQEFRCEQVLTLDIPSVEGQRHLVVLKPTLETVKAVTP